MLKFYRWTGILPDEPWTCTVMVGMPLRTAVYGVISATSAANITAGIASEAASKVMHMKPELPPGIFCFTLKTEMRTLFQAQYKSLGASVK